MNAAVEAIERCLASRRAPIALGLLSAALLFPALFGGFQLDDHFQRFRLLGLGEPALQLFVFYDGDPGANRAEMQAGTLPWWASPGLRHANFRYLSVLSMQLDYLLWPDEPLLMHLHSLLWLALTITLASLLYRRLFAGAGRGALWAAGLAALLYAVDDAHSLPTAYLANRNALIATCFGLLSLWAHVRWREDSWRPGAVLGPLGLALALLAGELGVSAIAFLGAWALILDRGKLMTRLLPLVPHAIVTVIWLCVHRLGGFGSEGSGFYVDPLREPLDFAALLVDRSLALLLGQWTPIPADWAALMNLGTREALPLRIAGLVLLLPLVALFGSTVRSSRLCRFFLVGSLLSLAPITATGPQNRLLFFVGFGAFGMIGCLAVHATGPARRFGLFVLFALHLAAGPAMAYLFLDLQNRAARAMERASASVPDDPALANRDLILVNPADSVYLTTSIPMMRWIDGRPGPRRMRVLAHGSTAVRITRLDEQTLRLELEDGLFPDAFSRYYRSSDRPFQVGDGIDLGDLRVEVEELDEGGRGPSTLSYRFSVPLESEELLWMVWNGSEYEPWDPPTLGTTVAVARQSGIFGY